jgi:hypothetical protein
MRFHSINYQRVGYLSYRLYSLGWRNGLHNCLPLAQHWLLSPLLYYRRGFAEGSKWVKEYRLEGNLH